MEKTILVRDIEGERIHFITTNYMRVDFTSKIGTVVITDLRLGGMPTDIVTRATMKLESMVLEGAVGSWTFSDSGIKPFFGHGTVFYLVVSGDKMLIQS